MPNTVVENKDQDRLITVSFPIGLLKQVDEVVNREMPRYMSRADFCRTAVRLLLEQEKHKVHTVFPTVEKKRKV